MAGHTQQAVQQFRLLPQRVGVARVQHGAVVEHDAIIGDDSVIHPNAVIGYGCRLGNEVVVGAGSIIGAGALVTEGKEIPERSLVVGSPAKAIRTLDAETVSRLLASAAHYVENARRLAKGMRRID